MMLFEAMEGRQLLSAGMLDPSFGNGGMVTTDLVASFESSCGLALRDDGRILLGGTAYQDMAVLRYTSSGRLDTAFGAGGVARLSLPGNDQAHAMLVQGDGKILIAGRSSTGAAVARFNADGSLDASFGDGGKVILTGTMAAAKAVALQGTNILLAGELGDSVMVWRLTETGAVDGSFGTAGRAAVSGLDDPAARALTVDSSGRILLAGTATDPITDTDYLLVRFTEQGQLDTTLGGDGVVLVDIGVNCNEAYTIDLLEDGRMVLAGDTCAGASIAMVHENGDLDTSFGSLGGLRDVFCTGGGGIADVAINDDGKIIVAGVSALDSGEFILARLNADGSADESFGNAGMMVTQFGGWRGKAAAVAIQPNGRVLAAGEANSMFALARYIADPADIDVMPPSASASASGITAAGQAEHRFTVAYSPDVQAATVGDGDILVTGPGSFRRAATLISIDGTTAIYAIAPPIGPWTGAHSGTYTLTLQDDEVADTTGNFARSAAIGTFAVDIPIDAPAGLASILGTPGSDVIQLTMNGTDLIVTVNSSSIRYIAATVQRIEIRADSGHDTVIVGPGVISCWIDGGTGNDTLYGGAGNDTIYGGSDNDRIYGGGGHDRLYGQDGDDLLDGGAGNDLVSGGAGRDTASYATRRAALRISLDNKANDGQAREKDNVRSDIEDITGGLGNDLIVGSRLNNILRGGRGNDTLVGNGGKDRLFGGPGKNVLQ